MQYHSYDKEQKYQKYLQEFRYKQKMFIIALTSILYVMYAGLGWHLASYNNTFIPAVLNLSVAFILLFILMLYRTKGNLKKIDFLFYLSPIYAAVICAYLTVAVDSFYVISVHIMLLWIFIATGWTIKSAWTVSIIVLTIHLTILNMYSPLEYDKTMIHYFMLFCAVAFGYLTAYLLEYFSRLNFEYQSSMLISQKELKKQSYTDELTQLHNRKSFNENIKKSLGLFNRYKTPFTLMIYDIDNFKEINDKYGHKEGDNALINLSKYIKSHIRENDSIFRIGGEEFIIIENGKIFSEQICNNVSDSKEIFEYERITISIGITQVVEGDTEDSIFKRADDLLYEAKRSGKNKVKID